VKARSRVGGTFFLSDRPAHKSVTPSPSATPSLHNGAVHTISSIMRNVMSSTIEAELAALFHNARDGIPLRTTLIEMGHPQAETPIHTENACASGIVNDKVKQHRFTSIDMRFYWIQDRIKQG
jgi:hypothetical protein